MNVSLNFREQAYAQETGVVVICLITITHPSLTEPILISTDPTERLIEEANDIFYGTKSRGNDYLFLPISLKLPDDTDEGPRNMRIEFDNVTRKYTETIRSISGFAHMKTEMVLSNALDSVDAVWPEFLLTHVRYDATIVSCQLNMETLEREPLPAMSMDPARCPALFDIRKS